jgi:hypothetical protein
MGSCFSIENNDKFNTIQNVPNIKLQQKDIYLGKENNTTPKSDDNVAPKSDDNVAPKSDDNVAPKSDDILPKK